MNILDHILGAILSFFIPLSFSTTIYTVGPGCFIAIAILTTTYVGFRIFGKELRDEKMSNMR